MLGLWMSPFEWFETIRTIAVVRVLPSYRSEGCYDVEVVLNGTKKVLQIERTACWPDLEPGVRVFRAAEIEELKKFLKRLLGGKGWKKLLSDAGVRKVPSEKDRMWLRKLAQLQRGAPRGAFRRAFKRARSSTTSDAATSSP